MYRNGQHTKARLTSFWPLIGLPIKEASMAVKQNSGSVFFSYYKRHKILQQNIRSQVTLASHMYRTELLKFSNAKLENVDYCFQLDN